MADAVGRPRDAVPITGDAPTNPTFVELVDSSGTETGTAANPLTVDLDAASLAALELVGVKGADGAGIASNANPVPVSDAGGSLTVDGPLTDVQLRASPVPVSGTVSVTEPVSVDDNGGSLTVDGTVALDAASLAALELVGVKGADGAGIASNANPVPVSDAGGSLTVDGPLTDVQLRASAVPVGLDAASLAALELVGVKGTDGAAIASPGNPLPVTGVVVTDITSVVPGTGATNLGKAEDAAHASGDVGIMALAVRKDAAAALAGTDGDYQPPITDAAGRLWSREAPDRASQVTGRTHKTAFLSNQTADASVYTVTGGKTLYVTQMLVLAFNTSTSNTGVLEIKDGNGGTTKVPYLMTPAGIAAQLAASAAVGIPLTMGHEPIQFTSAVYADITSGTLTYSIVFVGYEE